jgi:hypothetical protein
MRERLITLACAVGALALFLGMFFHGDEAAKGGDVPRPTTEEWRTNGYHGALLWLDQEHIRTVSVRDRFNAFMTRPRLPATGNVLIITLPAATAFKTEELRPLDSWVRTGNTLLVLAALADNPNWAFALGRPAAGDVSLLTGLEFAMAKSRGRPDAVGSRIATTARAFAQPQVATLIPNGPHPLFEGVHTALALSDYPARTWIVKIPYDGFALSLANERETGEGVLWLRPLGRGQVIVSGFGSLFTNRALGLANNGQLLANLVGATLGPGGAVLFDDMHQGLGAAYDPEKFYSDPRLYATVAVFAAVWLCWVLGATRLQLPQTRMSVPREADLVRTTGGFLARVLTSDAGARGLFEHFFQRLAARLPFAHARRDHAEPPWQLLEGHPGVVPADLRQLRQWHAAAAAARKVPLQRLHNLMLKIKASL